jgi:hypothetical protein
VAEGDTNETTFRREEEQDDQEDDGGLYISYDFKEKSGQFVRLETYLNLHVVHTYRKGPVLRGDFVSAF